MDRLAKTCLIVSLLFKTCLVYKYKQHVDVMTVRGGQSHNYHFKCAKRFTYFILLSEKLEDL